MSYVLTLLLAVGWAWVPPLGAKPTNCLTGQYSGLMVDRVIELAPAIAEQPSLGQGSRNFFQRQITLTLQPAQQVWLAGTPDGDGMLATDDQVQITVLTSGNHWAWDFRNASRTAIVPIAPVELTSLFMPGVNTVTFTAQDLMGPVFRTTPYYILLLTPCARRPLPVPPAPMATPTFTVIPSPTAISVWLPLAMRWDMPTLTATPAPPTETPRPLATATTTPVPPSVAAAPVVSSIAPELPQPPASGVRVGWPFLLALTGTAAALLFLVMKRRPRPVGDTELYQGAQFITSFNLRQPGKHMVTVGKQGDLRLLDPAVPDVIARFTAQRGADGEVETVLEVLEPDSKDVAQTLVLSHEDEVPLGMSGYRIRYLNYAEVEFSLREGEQYV